ncbi:hypothetical protein THALO_310001 [Tenacibaculum halocynthiae]
MDFRHYNPALGRFNSIDPMAEERNWLTPYNFVQNNPILRVDPTGLLDDYGLDTETGDLVFLKETDDKTDTIYTGTITGTNDDGSAKFEKDGKSSKTFEKGTSNIKEVTTQTDENGKTIGSGAANMQGLVFSEGNLQIGLEVMEFISFESNIELNAWGFKNGKGEGLYISDWVDNSAGKSYDRTDPSFDSVMRKGGNKIYGKKTGKVHTHPGTKDGRGGDGRPSGCNGCEYGDLYVKQQGKNRNYPHYINSKLDGWKEY